MSFNDRMKLRQDAKNSLYVYLVSKGAKPTAILDGPVDGYTIEQINKEFMPKFADYNKLNLAGNFKVIFKNMRMTNGKYIPVVCNEKTEDMANELIKLYPESKKRAIKEEHIRIGQLLGYDYDLCVRFSEKIET